MNPLIQAFGTVYSIGALIDLAVAFALPLALAAGLAISLIQRRNIKKARAARN